MRTPVPVDVLAQKWVRNLGRQFIDPTGPWYVSVAVVALALLSVLVVLRDAPRASRRLLVLLVCVTAVTVIGPDLLFGGQASQQTRHLLPALLFIAVCAGYAVDRMIGHPRIRFAYSGCGLWAVLLITGCWSCIGLVNAEYWWNKSVGGNNSEISRRLNAADRPLLIVEDDGVNQGEVLSLSHVADDKVQVPSARSKSPCGIR